VKEIDVGGIFLFTGGILLFIMGLSWGGVQYPWKSAHVISTIVVGFSMCVVFVFYGMSYRPVYRMQVRELMRVVEIYMPLKRPIVPMHLFKNLDYTNLVIVTTVGGMMYFSISGKQTLLPRPAV